MNNSPLRSRALLWLAALPLILVAGCASSAPDTPQPTRSTPTPSNTEVAPIRDLVTDLKAPWSIAFYGETPLVSERDSGRILELVPTATGTYDKRQLATIDEVSARGEGGLLRLAARSGFLYAYLTISQDNRIARYAVLGAWAVAL